MVLRPVSPQTPLTQNIATSARVPAPRVARMMSKARLTQSVLLNCKNVSNLPSIRQNCHVVRSGQLRF